MIREKLLDEATSLGLKIYQNPLGKWIIEDIKDDKKWLLQEKESDRWIMISNKIPGIILDAKLALKLLKRLAWKDWADKKNSIHKPQTATPNLFSFGI